MTDHKTDITDSRNPMSLGTLPIGKLLMQYSVPAIIAAVTMSLYNIIDSIFIGRGVGAMAIAGLAITFPLMNLVIAFCTFIAVGGATISSIYMGQKEMSKATDVINNVLVLCLIHSLVFGGLTFIFLDDVLTLFGATPEMLPYAREFMRVILLGTPIAYVFIGLNNLMRATGYPRKAMVSALLSVGVNIVLCPIFIYKFKWGIGGAAFASVCGQFTAFCWVVLHFCSKKSFVHFDRHNRWFTPSIIKKIYSIGLSPFLMNTTACVVVVFLNMALLTYGGVDGNLAVGAYGIVNRTTMFFVMVVFGVTQLNYFIFPLQVSIIFVHKVGQKLKSLQRPGISQPGRVCRKWGTAHANASAKANRAAPCKTPGRAQIKRSNSTTKASPTIRAGRAHAA
mgnify:CR=1 FL=1